MLVEVIGDDDYRVYLGELPFPILVRSRDVASRIELLEQLRPAILERAAVIAEVDLRFESRVIVRPGTAAPESETASANETTDETTDETATGAAPVEGVDSEPEAGDDAPVEPTRSSVWDPQSKET